MSCVPEEKKRRKDADIVPSFNDPYSAVDAATPGYIGDLAIVFHNSTAARVACANLVKVWTATASAVLPNLHW